MHMEQVDLADVQTIRACDEVSLAAQEADCPEESRLTGSPFRGWLTVGWDGNPREVWLAADRDGDGTRRVLGWYRLELPERENRDRANLDLFVHPAQRRRGLGTALLRHAAVRAAEHERSVLASATRDGTPGAGFARSAGAEPGVVEIQRMLELGKLADGRLERLREQAEQASSGYSVVSWTGPVPEEFIERVAPVYDALNDAPHDAGEAPTLWDGQRVREANARRPYYGTRDYAAAAVHAGTGDVVALTEVSVDPDSPDWAHQAITGVARAHRGHRLGLRVKVAMLETLVTAEPQVERMSTWNGAENPYMIAVNEALGYTILGPPSTSQQLAVAAALG
jgi:GNAT superfamily N-acetyltransferase